MSRLTFVYILITLTASGVLMASGVRSQNLKEIKVKLNNSGSSLKGVLDELEKQSGISFYFTEDIGNIHHIKVSEKAASLYDVLKEIANDKRLNFKQSDWMIAIVKVPDLPKPPKPGRISGKIMDDKGETLPGASVRIVETGAGAQAGADGSYILNISPGTYTLEVSYISFQTYKITGVIVTEDKNTPLNVSLKPDAKGLKEVVVTSGYKKASTAGLLAKQKNASEISNGISAEQIARTPDKNIGESLKRISGVSTVDNKFVLVRGIGERYNSATLDGTVLPSTEAQSRNFSFDMIPSNLVDNVIVSKTVTPDMNASFGGGLIQINTKDIPNENFMSFSVGAAYNDQTTGKDFLSHKRGKYDYFGYDDGGRDYPQGLTITVRGNIENENLTEEAYQKKIDDQSKRFTGDNFTMYKYKAIPSQNYQFSIGRLLSVDSLGKNKFGFTGALSYRNTQTINKIEKNIRGGWYNNFDNAGASYGFNTTLGGIFNAGLQLGKNKFSSRNTYTHVYDNALVRIYGYDIINGNTDVEAKKPFSLIRESDDPTYTDLLQNKITGQHKIGHVKIEWDIARTSIKRQEKDVSVASSGPILVDGVVKYIYFNGKSTEAIITDLSRQHYFNTEKHYSWNLSGSLPFELFGSRNILKTGYFGNRKKASFDWQIAVLTGSGITDEELTYLPVSERLKAENMRKNGFTYVVTPYFLDKYNGKSEVHAGYAMLDNRFSEKLRLVWGLRTEYYSYTEINNGLNIKGASLFSKKPDPHWQWMPSANLTYSPEANLNIRAAYSSSVVRPELMDNSQFFRYSPYLDADYGNEGLYSTRIDSWDLKTEWFPGLGELISVGGFYKKFDKPAELTFNNKRYYLKSGDWAKVYGLEFELRKTLGFIAATDILNKLSIYGNLTLQKSEVRSFYTVKNPDPKIPEDIQVAVKQTRAMYGQSPYQINVGLQYTGNEFGFNLIYNKSGYKTYIVSESPTLIEYEKARDIVDAQISYKFFKKRLEIKLNASNLLNKASIFYRNTASYEANPDAVNGDSDYSDTFRLKSGFTNNYEDGDQVTFIQRFGRTYSTTLTWNF